ncbi:hypothetical protein LGH93_004224 [Salmonella enterica subsp. enterica serovar Telelkebir]|nr:hypothetical protein [Salmonella enterica subsp. enterica serovar Telelkebir]
MGTLLRWAAFFVGLLALGYSIYTYTQSSNNLHYIIGGIGAVISAIIGLIELKKKNDKGKDESIKAGNNSNIVVISGNDNSTSIKR